MPVTEIFSLGGEPLFRDTETEVIREISAKSAVVIATGGGAVLREENVRALRQNGRICFINRPLDALPVTDSRPLSSDRQKALCSVRRTAAHIQKTCDFEADGAGSVEKNHRNNFKGVRL